MVWWSTVEYSSCTAFYRSVLSAQSFHQLIQLCLIEWHHFQLARSDRWVLLVAAPQGPQRSQGSPCHMLKGMWQLSPIMCGIRDECMVLGKNPRSYAVVPYADIQNSHCVPPVEIIFTGDPAGSDQVTAHAAHDLRIVMH